MFVVHVTPNGYGHTITRPYEMNIWKSSKDMFKGLRAVLEGFVVPMHEGAVETGSQIPWPIGRGFLTYCSHKPECIERAIPDRSVLSTIITRHFQIHHMNVSNLYVIGKYVFVARAAIEKLLSFRAKIHTVMLYYILLIMHIGTGHLSD